MTAFGSHIPVLEWLCEQLKPPWVLEYGAGEYSTPFLLEQGVDLVSVEDNPRYRAVQGPNHWVVPRRISPEGFDLVLVDDFPDNGQRLETIRYVLTRPHPITVVHDTSIDRRWKEECYISGEPVTTFDTEPETSVIGDLSAIGHTAY